MPCRVVVAVREGYAYRPAVMCPGIWRRWRDTVMSLRAFHWPHSNQERDVANSLEDFQSSPLKSNSVPTPNGEFGSYCSSVGKKSPS